MELLLSILIAISAGFAIERLVDVSDTLVWLFLSLLSICISLWFIYEMLEIEFPSRRNLSRLCVLIFVMFLPFTFARLDSNVALESTRFVWGNLAEMVYGLLLGAAFIAWGKFEKEEFGEKKKHIWIIGLILILLSIGLYLFFGGKS